MHPTETPEDRELVERLERCALGDGEFGHAAHVRAAWIYLRRHGLARGASHFAEALRRFARSRGATDLYHETITWAFLVLINERMAALPPDHGWAAFAPHNSDLLGDGTSLLERFYRPETLHSERAKRTFVLPDRLAPPTRSTEATRRAFTGASH